MSTLHTFHNGQVSPGVGVGHNGQQRFKLSLGLNSGVIHIPTDRECPPLVERGNSGRPRVFQATVLLINPRGKRDGRFYTLAHSAVRPKHNVQLALTKPDAAVIDISTWGYNGWGGLITVEAGSPEFVMTATVRQGGQVLWVHSLVQLQAPDDAVLVTPQSREFPQMRQRYVVFLDADRTPQAVTHTVWQLAHPID